MMRYGMEGYGLYWFCLEAVARNVEKHNLTFELEHDAETIAYETRLHIDHVQEVMAFMVDLGLFENDRGVVTCLKMAARTDEYTQKVIKQNGGIGILSGVNPEKSELIEENRIEQNRKEENKKPQKAKASALRKPDGVSDSVWKDFKKQRKTPLTETALNGIIKQANLAGYSLEEALTESVERGWQSFKAEWVNKKANQSNQMPSHIKMVN